MPYPVREITDFAELAPLRDAWGRLLAVTPEADFFRTYDWLEVYWKHFSQQQQLRVLVVGDPGAPIGILPLVLRREPTRLGRIKVLTWPLDGWGAVYGPIGPEHEPVLLAGMRYLQTTGRDWDLLELRYATSREPQREATVTAMHEAGFSPISWESAQSAYVELSAGWEAYWGSRTSKWRNNVRRSEKKLAEQGELRYQRMRVEGSDPTADPQWDLYDACVAVAQNSWQAASCTGNTITHHAVKAFLRDAHQVAVACGAVDVNLLYRAEHPIAFAYNYLWNGRVFGLRQGYDPLAAKEGAGTVLMRHMLEDSCQRGDRRFDLGVDYLQCKRYWWTGVAPTLCHAHYGRTVKAQAIRLKRWLTADVNAKLVT